MGPFATSLQQKDEVPSIRPEFRRIEGIKPMSYSIVIFDPRMIVLELLVSGRSWRTYFAKKWIYKEIL